MGLNTLKTPLGTMSHIRESLRTWANKPSRREIKELERLKQIQNVKASEESSSVRMLRKHNAMLEDLLKKAYETITSQAEVIQGHTQGDWQDKLITKGLDMLPFLFNKQSPPIDITPNTQEVITPEVPLEAETLGSNNTETKPASKGLTHEEIKEYVGSIGKEFIPKLASLEYDKFSALIKTKIPQATQENIFEGYELIQTKNEELKNV